MNRRGFLGKLLGASAVPMATIGGKKVWDNPPPKLISPDWNERLFMVELKKDKRSPAIYQQVTSFKDSGNGEFANIEHVYWLNNSKSVTINWIAISNELGDVMWQGAPNYPYFLEHGSSLTFAIDDIKITLS